MSALLQTPMKALENELEVMGKRSTVHAKVRTTDATVTTLKAVMVPANTTVLMRGAVVARRTGGVSGAANDGAGYLVDFVATNTAGVAALIGAGTVTVLGESQAAWAVTLVASGGDVLVKVTGAAGNNVTWTWTERVVSVVE